MNDQDIRLLQSITDFQMALSAFDFICELDEDDTISRIERRRFRCFEDAAVVAYWRPFTQSNGLPALSMKKLGINPSKPQMLLHKRIKTHRNKVVAHTDADRMRLALKTSKVRGHDVMLPTIDFDDGLAFFDERYELIEWLRILIQRASHLLFERVQGDSEVSFLRDHLLEADRAE